MTATLQTQSNDWMVFVDGVQVPWMSFAVSFGVDTPMTGTLTLEPDGLLWDVAPGAVVALFFRDRYGAPGRPFGEEWLYYGGGEVTGVSDQRQPRARSMQLAFESDFKALRRHAAFASSFGGSQGMALVQGLASGSVLVPPFGADSTALDGWFAAALLARTFAAEADETEADPTYRAAAERGGFGGRLLRLFGWLLAHNASLRMHADRTRMGGRICALDDRLLLEAARYRIAQSFAQAAVADRLSAGGSVYDVLASTAEFGGYRTIFVAAPSVPTRQPAGPEAVPPLLGVLTSDKTALYRSWYRNDAIVAPNLYYAPPPPCNFVFPDMVASHSVETDYFERPTRSMYVENQLGTYVAFVEGGRTLGTTPKHPAEYWGNLVGYLSQRDAGGREAQTDLSAVRDAYAAPEPSAFSSGANLLRLLSDEEFERGVLLQNVPPDSDLMYALSRASGEAEDVAVLDQDGLFDTSKLERAARNGFNDENSYFYFVQRWLAYKHRLAQRAARASFTLAGHRWLVPGFPAVVFGFGVTYVGVADTVQTVVSADGVEQNTLSMTRVRALRSVAPSAVAAARVAANKTEAYRAEREAGVRDAYADDSASVRADAATLRTAADALAARDAEIAAAPTRRAAIEARYAPQAELFRVRFRSLSERAAEYASAAYGRSRERGALFAVSTDAGLGEALQPFLGFRAPPDPASPEGRAEAAARGAAAADVVLRFNDAQVDHYRASDGVAVPPPGVVAALSRKTAALAEMEDAVRSAAAALAAEDSAAAPPPFFNPDLLDPARADGVYRDLLGCRPFYSGTAYAVSGGAPRGGWTPRTGKDAVDRPPDWIPGRDAAADPSAAAIEAHATTVESLSRVFPALRDASRSRGTAAAAGYDDWAAASAGSEGTLAWQHRRFLRRDAQTLAGYLETHGFEREFEEIFSDEPVPTRFLRMRPKPSDAGALSAGGRSWRWDDSVVSRLVDADALRGAGASASVAERRGEARRPSLSSEYRQAVVVAYSRRHFGSRAIGGEA